MEFTFLGTSSGAPTKTRNVSGLALILDNTSEWYLVDCGEGTQHRLLETSYTLSRLSAIFITHVHGDHCFGLPGLLASAQLTGRTKPLTIVAPPGVRRFLSAAQEETDTHVGYELRFVEVAAGSVFQNEMVAVEAIELAHRVPSFAYRFTEPAPRRALDEKKVASWGIPRGPMWGQLKRGETIVLDDGKRIGPEDCLAPPRRARSIIIAGDNAMPALLADTCEEVDCLVHEATYTEEIMQGLEGDYQHSSAASVARMADGVGLPNLVLTHFSRRFSDNENSPNSILQVEHEVKKHYRHNLVLAQDFMNCRLSRDGRLQYKLPASSID